MGESSREDIERLLADGLNEYGLGRVAQAIRVWRQVLALDPTNAEAREYLDSALDEADEAERFSSHDVDAGAELLGEALQRLRDEDPEAALELLETVARTDPDGLEVHGYIDLVRSRLVKRYRDRIGDGGGVPVVKLSSQQLLKYNLPTDAGFLLSMMDGHTSVDELASLSGMDEFRLLRLLSQMLDAGIVEIRK